MNQRDLIASAIQGKHIPCSKPDTATQIDMRATRNRFNPSMTVKLCHRQIKHHRQNTVRPEADGGGIKTNLAS